MKPASIPLILTFLSILIAPIYADEVYTEEQKEKARVFAIVLPDFTKQDVLETLGMPKKKGFFHTGQETWYYKYPQEQFVFFEDDEVTDVRFKAEFKPEHIKQMQDKKGTVLF